MTLTKQIAPYVADVLEFGYEDNATGDERNFRTLFSQWFDTFVAPRYESSTTEENRRSMNKLHIIPAFETFDVKDIDDLKCQRFINRKLIEQKLSSDYVLKMKQMLNNFFAYAVSKRVTKVNPMLCVKLPKAVRIELHGEEVPENRDKMALSPKMRVFVLEKVESNPILKPIVHTLLFSGIRPQELIGLKKENLDLEMGILSVRRAMNRVTLFDEEGNVTGRTKKRGKTKSEKSVRDIKIPKSLVAVLKEWFDYCATRGIKSDFVFPSAKTGKMRSYTGLRSLLERFICKHRETLRDEEITLYTFRHPYVQSMPKKIFPNIGIICKRSRMPAISKHKRT